MLLFRSLDLSPLHSILWKDLHIEGAGRPVEYDPECDLRALMLRQLEQIPYIKDLVKRLQRSKDMRSACGYDNKVPTEAHFSQMKKRIGVEGFRAIEGFPLGHVEAPANVNEKMLVESLLDRLLGEDIEVELMAGDSQFESSQIFDALSSRKISGGLSWRRLKGRGNPSDVGSVKDRIDVEGPQYLRVVYKMLRAKSESLNGRVKARLAYSRLTWQGLGNACIHTCLVFCAVYAVVIAAAFLEKTGLQYSIAYFA